MREFLRFFASKRDVQLAEVDAIFDEFKETRCVTLWLSALPLARGMGAVAHLSVSPGHQHHR